MAESDARAAVNFLLRTARNKAGLESLELPGAGGEAPVTDFDSLPDAHKSAVEGAAAKLDRPEQMTPSEHFALEAIIIPDRRPAILIAEAPEGETIEPATVSANGQRVYGVQVSCVVSHRSGHAEEARALGAEVERVLGSPGFPVPRPGRSRLAATRLTSDGEGEVPMASQEQLWRFTYFTRRGAPDVAL